jgi:hypothetical protein
MRAMARPFRALIVLALCSCDPPAKPVTTADPPASTAKAEPARSEPAEQEPAKGEPAKGDPVLLKICKAFDDVTAENKPDQDHLLAQRTAARAVELGVSEAQIEALGPMPPQLLASIRARGNPPECAAFVAYLEKLPALD